MLKSDKYYKEMLSELKTQGIYDKNPRPKWSDGTPAHSKFVTQQTMSYNIDAGEFPLPTIRHTSVKMGINEILAIYQSQTNTSEGFKSHKVFWWDEWMNDEGNLGTAYAFNLESHLGSEEFKIDKTFKSRDYKSPLATFDKPKDYSFTVNNFSEDDIIKLKNLWDHTSDTWDICERWESFDNFLRDVRYLPHYFLAKNDNFEGWGLSKNYYEASSFAPETTVFMKYDKIEMLDVFYSRKELSRNQIVELLKGLEKDPYGRRHMLSLYNWKNQPRKTLVECAFMNVFAVREDEKGFILDQNLIQRSSDFITASFINASQYVFLGMAFCNHLTYVTGNNWRMGKFKYDINNLHCYDRHEKYIDFILEQKGVEVQPNFEITRLTDFFDLTIDDIKINNNNGLPQLQDKLEIAI